MTTTQFALGIARLAGFVVPAYGLAHILRRRYLDVSGALAALTEVVLALSVVLVVAEALGLLRLMRPAVQIPTLILLALAVWRGAGGRRLSLIASSGLASRRLVFPRDVTTLSAAAAVVVVFAQWCVQSSDALGSGMANFDTLWYHMPFAAHMALTNSVTGTQFTQADPFVAYYPANSELFHALGVQVLQNDFLSPLLNLGWLTVALLAGWCVGRPWRVERLTLIATCVVMGLPVLSGSQPGQAFNDTVGLAMLAAGAALVLNADGEVKLLAVAGLALGLAAGTKLTFVVPALMLAGATAASAANGPRRRELGALMLPLSLTGGWWYLRNLLAVGNPEGLRLDVGPLRLPGPTSPLESASQQSVISQVSHWSLWGSRFAPGLDHALGPVWPLMLLLFVLAVFAGIATRSVPVRLLALAALVTGIVYLFLPTGAAAIDQGSTLFQVNVRYLTPALLLGFVLIPIVLKMRHPHLLRGLGPALLVALLLALIEHPLWPTQPARHLVFLIALAAVVSLLFTVRVASRRASIVVAGAAMPVLVVGAFLVQRHYFDQRYLLGDRAEPVLGVVDRWAQGVDHSRIALYGDVRQYPLYGADDTNDVDYLGAHISGGGYRPITSCQQWRTTINEGRYRYVVLTPAPTAPIPIAWTQDDPAARLILSPAANADVFEIERPMSPSDCTHRSA